MTAQASALLHKYAHRQIPHTKKRKNMVIKILMVSIKKKSQNTDRRRQTTSSTDPNFGDEDRERRQGSDFEELFTETFSILKKKVK